MAEKRGWLTNPATGEKFHAWSHVKAIFYNKASNILLKDKLDEMDKLIDEKIKKAMMSNVQVNDQNKVPTSALAYAMQQSITNNKEAVDQLNRDMDTAKTYFFGGRVYATKGSGDNYLSKTINLPSAFAKNDVNNYFVSVTTEGDTSIPGETQVFIQKGIGQFTVFFRKKNAVSESDTQWFDYTVIIAH